MLAFVWLQIRCFFVARTVGPKRQPGQPASDLEALGHALAGVVVAYVVCGFFLSQAYGAYSFAVYGLVLGLAKVTILAQQGAAAPAGGPRRARARGGWRPPAGSPVPGAAPRPVR